MGFRPLTSDVVGDLALMAADDRRAYALIEVEVVTTAARLTRDPALTAAVAPGGGTSTAHRFRRVTSALRTAPAAEFFTSFESHMVTMRSPMAFVNRSKMAAEKTAETAKKATTDKALDVQSLVRLEVAAALNGVLGQIQSRMSGQGELAAAYVRAVKGSRDAFKNAQNPHLRNQYADLGSVLDSVRESFLGNGLWLMQSPGPITVKEGQPYITMSGILIHESGQSISLSMELPAFSVSKDGKLVLNPQTSGSALSYARRYMWVAVAGITQTDDDAAEASFIDTSQGPAKSFGTDKAVAAEKSAPTQVSTPKSDTNADMIKRLQAMKSMDELKALREAAQACKDKKVSDCYMAMRDTFQPA